MECAKSEHRAAPKRRRQTVPTTELLEPRAPSVVSLSPPSSFSGRICTISAEIEASQTKPGRRPEAKTVSRSVVVELDMPGELKQFRLPRAVESRLQQLLDKQSRAGKLPVAERQDAEGLVDLAEMLTLLRLRAERVAG